MKIAVRDRQCLVDIALQACGSVEAVFAIAERNGLAITDDLVVGQALTYETADIEDKQVVAAYASNGVFPAGAADARAIEELLTYVDPDDNSGILDSTTEATTTMIFTEQFDTTFA